MVYSTTWGQDYYVYQKLENKIQIRKSEKKGQNNKKRQKLTKNTQKKRDFWHDQKGQKNPLQPTRYKRPARMIKDKHR